MYFFLHSLLCNIQYPFSKNTSYIAYLRLTLTIAKILLLSFGASRAAFLRTAVDKSHSFFFNKTYSVLDESF